MKTSADSLRKRGREKYKHTITEILSKKTEKKRVINVIFLRVYRLDSLKAACYILNG